MHITVTISGTEEGSESIRVDRVEIPDALGQDRITEIIEAGIGKAYDAITEEAYRDLSTL